MEETWNNEECLKLITVYQNFPELWDTKNPFYYTKRKRQECWNEIARLFDLNVVCIKRKMSSLLGSFRSQKSKGKILKGEGANMREVYKSNWFAFEKMRFLIDEKGSQQDTGTGNDSEDALETVEIKSENDSDIEFFDDNSVQNNPNDEIITNSPNSVNDGHKEYILPIPVDVTLIEDDSIEEKTNNANSLKNFDNPKIIFDNPKNFDNMNNEYGIHFSQPESENIVSGISKEGNNNYRRKRTITENCYNESSLKIARVESSQQSNYNNNCTMSEEELATASSSSFCIFGQYVSGKLKGYSIKTRAIAENAINNILFEADMGWYENISPQSRARTS